MRRELAANAYVATLLHDLASAGGVKEQRVGEGRKSAGGVK